MQNSNDYKRQLPYIPRALALVWQAAPRWTFIWALLLVVSGLLPVATVYLTKSLVDGLVAAIEAGGSRATLQPVLIVAALMALVMLLQAVLSTMAAWVRTAQSELISDHLTNLVHTQALELDMSYYEDQRFYDVLNRVNYEAINQPLNLLENLGAMVQNTITLVAMGAVLLRFGIWLPLALALSTLPALFVVVSHNRRRYRWRMGNTLPIRRANYYKYLITSRDAVPELRVFDLGSTFKNTYEALREELRAGTIGLQRRQALTEAAAGLFGIVMLGVTMIWMLFQTVVGSLTLGDLALFYQAFMQGQGLLRTLLRNAGSIMGNVLFLDELFLFLALEPRLKDTSDPRPMPVNPQEGLCFEEITFRYPGAESPTLKNFNLSIPAGQTVAIVGANGAGKSTLIKLLCRFFDPEAGRVMLDGLDLRDLPLAEVRRLYTVLFQEPQHYSDSAADNIAFGNLSADPQMDEIQAAAVASGADTFIRKLPQGYDTVLGKWFGGAELSVGEWQRLALARAFVRQSPVILLDEPTSAMDSWAEMDWFARFRELAKGRTAVIITHRFTTAMQADLIHVMVDGQIIESGSHADLVSQGSMYAQSWAAQMRTVN